MVSKFNYINVINTSVQLENRKIIIWGKSVSALGLYVELHSKNIEVIGFTDSYVKEVGQIFAELPVFTMDEIKSMHEVTIYVSTVVSEYQRKILELTNELENATVLIKGDVYGCGKYDINRMNSIIQNDMREITFVRNHLEDEKSVHTFDNLLQYRQSNKQKLIEEVYETGHPQYFPEYEILAPKKGEVFIDAGAYNGDTSCQFAQWNNEYAQIYLLEPDKLMFHIAKEYIKLHNVKNVEFVNKAAFSSSTELCFKSDAESGSSRIDNIGEMKIQTICIDELLENQKVSFIKMDIEGAELEALKGAEKAITQCKPKLAISIYHKENDLWKIPYYIKKKYPFYKLYIRHYTAITTETILYASI